MLCNREIEELLSLRNRGRQREKGKEESRDVCCKGEREGTGKEKVLGGEEGAATTSGRFYLGPMTRISQ